MNEHESRLPLLVGAIISVVAHFGLLPLTTLWLTGRSSVQANRLESFDLSPVLPGLNPIELGQGSPKTFAVALIAYDEFREMVSPTHQSDQAPAPRRNTDVTRDVPPLKDPTPPAPPREVALEVPIKGPSPLHHPEAALIQPSQPSPSRPEASQNSSDGKSTATTTHAPSPKADPEQPPAGKDEQKGRPDATPLTDSELSPLKLNPYNYTVQPGGYLVTEGIKIKTVYPNFTMVTLLSLLPQQPKARLVFSHRTGQVMKAQLIESSGYPGIDRPVLTSLFKWQATGTLLGKLNRPFELQAVLQLEEQSAEPNRRRKKNSGNTTR